jgi:hypothetical protein
MAHCSRCLCVTLGRAGVCGRCGLPVSDPTDELTAPLPERMVEPVLPPTPSELVDSPPHNPALVQPCDDDDEDAVIAYVSRGPQPGDPNRTHAQTADTVQNSVAGSPRSARSAPPGFPMNESVAAEPVHNTVPATDRANQPPATPPPSVRPRLVVLRGVRIGAEYPVYEGRNTIGRFADKPVDIDLVSQESTEQIWCSRQHAVLVFEKGNLLIEDLNSLNGTWVNGARIHAGQARQLRAGDVIQIGTVQMKLVIG